MSAKYSFAASATFGTSRLVEFPVAVAKVGEHRVRPLVASVFGRHCLFLNFLFEFVGFIFEFVGSLFEFANRK